MFDETQVTIEYKSGIAIFRGDSCDPFVVGFPKALELYDAIVEEVLCRDDAGIVRIVVVDPPMGVSCNDPYLEEMGPL